MEPHQQLQHPTGNDQEGGKGSSFICRQSSSRWTPTTDQIRILKDLYYNNGIRSPSAEQIQRISAKLRQYGKIEGKNVFYWFQNHKARERQKKRFTADHSPLHRNGVWKNEDVSPLYNKFSNINSVSFPSSSPGLINVGAVGNFGNVSLAVEKSFRDCSITSNSNGTGGSMAAQNSTWIGVDPYSSPYPFLENTKLYVETLEIEDDDIIPEDERSSSTLREIETLPLFPIHTANIKQQQQQTHDYFNGCQNHYSAASLELTLNSYAPPAFPNTP